MHCAGSSQRELKIGRNRQGLDSRPALMMHKHHDVNSEPSLRPMVEAHGIVPPPPMPGAPIGGESNRGDSIGPAGTMVCQTSRVTGESTLSSFGEEVVKDSSPVAVKKGAIVGCGDAVGPVRMMKRRTSRVAEEISATLASSFGGEDVNDSDPIVGGGHHHRPGGSMARRSSRRTEALSTLASSLGINAFDSRPEREPAGRNKPPPPPSLAASGKANPFRGKPFRYENVRGKTHVLVQDEELWRDFKAELEYSGVKTALGVKMVLLRFVTQRIPGDESATRAALDALWQRKKVEDHVASGNMKNFTRSPSLVDLYGGGGGGGGFRARGRASHASLPAYANGGGGPMTWRNGSFYLGRMSFRSAQTAPAQDYGVGSGMSVGSGMKSDASSGSLAALVDIPSKIIAGMQNVGNGDSCADDANVITSGNFPCSTSANDTTGVEVTVSSDKKVAASAQRKSGFAHRASRGSNAQGMNGQADFGEYRMQDSMARAAAIVAAMGLDDLSSNGSEIYPSGNADNGEDDGTDMAGLPPSGSSFVGSSRSATASRRLGIAQAIMLQSAGTPAQLDLPFDDEGDDNNAGIVSGPGRYAPRPDLEGLIAESDPVDSFVVGYLNDLDAQQSQEEDYSNGIDSGRFGKSRHRQSYGTPSAGSLGTMSMADMTIEEDLDEDLDSSDEKSKDQKGDDGPGAWAGGIECTSIGYGQYEAVSEYGVGSEYGVDSDSGAVSCEDTSESCRYECGKGYMDYDEAQGYVDGDGNVDLNEGQYEQCLRQKAAPLLDEHQDEGQEYDVNDNRCDKDKGEGDDDGFILSFPSPEERAVIRGANERDCEEEGDDHDDEEDDDEEPLLNFPPLKEREMKRMNSCKTWAGRANQEEEEEEKDYDGNASSRTCSGCSTQAEESEEHARGSGEHNSESSIWTGMWFGRRRQRAAMDALRDVKENGRRHSMANNRRSRDRHRPLIRSNSVPISVPDKIEEVQRGC